MRSAASAIRSVALRGMDEFPLPVSGQRHEIGSSVGRLTYYSASPEEPSQLPPMLFIHSINAAGSAYEIMPLYEHYRQSRTVYALELPGFGHSERGKRPYTVRMMTDAILIAVREIQDVHGNEPIEALAVSLSSEFLARAVAEHKSHFFSEKDATGRPVDYLAAVAGSLQLVPEGAAREALAADYASMLEDQVMVGGFLFSENIMRIYHSLTLPVWMSHGVRGDFVDYSNKIQVEDRANWTVKVFQTGAMPHFEARIQFIAAYDAFLAGASPPAA